MHKKLRIMKGGRSKLSPEEYARFKEDEKKKLEEHSKKLAAQQLQSTQSNPIVKRTFYQDPVSKLVTETIIYQNGNQQTSPISRSKFTSEVQNSKAWQEAAQQNYDAAQQALATAYDVNPSDVFTALTTIAGAAKVALGNIGAATGVVSGVGSLVTKHDKQYEQASEAVNQTHAELDRARKKSREEDSKARSWEVADGKNNLLREGRDPDPQKSWKAGQYAVDPSNPYVGPKFVSHAQAQSWRPGYVIGKGLAKPKLTKMPRKLGRTGPKWTHADIDNAFNKNYTGGTPNFDERTGKYKSGGGWAGNVWNSIKKDPFKAASNLVTGVGHARGAITELAKLKGKGLRKQKGGSWVGDKLKGAWASIKKHPKRTAAAVAATAAVAAGAYYGHKHYNKYKQDYDTLRNEHSQAREIVNQATGENYAPARQINYGLSGWGGLHPSNLGPAGDMVRDQLLQDMVEDGVYGEDNRHQLADAIGNPIAGRIPEPDESHRHNWADELETDADRERDRQVEAARMNGTSFVEPPPHTETETREQREERGYYLPEDNYRPEADGFVDAADGGRLPRTRKQVNGLFPKTTKKRRRSQTHK